MKINITKNKLIVSILIIITLALAFWYGGGAPGLQGWDISPKGNKGLVVGTQDNSEKDIDLKKDEVQDKIEEIEETVEIEETEEDKKEQVKEEQEVKEQIEQKLVIEERVDGTEGKLSASDKVTLAKEIAGDISSEIEEGSIEYSKSEGMEIDENTGKDKYLTDPVPEGKPVPVEPEDSVIKDIPGKCILSVRCDTILDNIEWLNPEKIELVPEDGIIYKRQEVTFYEGESVFNVLLREMKKSKIHMEFSKTPIYNSAYIEGINNLYEFDCGELSGWMYKVNDWFPNYGASRYKVKEGDIIEWVYTCNLGVDVGGFSAIGGE